MKNVGKTFVALACAAALLVGVPATPAAAAPVPLPAFDVPPAGANDYQCRPQRKQRPVILVHGTFGDQKSLLDPLSAALVDAGYCVFSFDYGNRATGPIEDSAQELKRYTRRVLRATGAKKVSMVGHSQGGMMPRYYLKFLGGAKRVDDLVGIAPSNHGTEYTSESGPGALLNPAVQYLCYACVQQGSGSRFLTSLNAGDETPGRVSYTQIITRYDQVVVPATNGYLAPGRRTTNVAVQDVCPHDPSEHLMIPTSKTTIALVLDALGHRGPARPRRVTCGS
ncbi:MAG: alpha/beta fold hydrolase [Nocardioides sp.]|nr:alpha/beta fold hydrolase [Nocardioides sp.]